ncbi:MAG: Phosphate transport system permease protein PstA [Fimbriimonadaceae bacterium]|nr:Phosphate transport system permease protein PstA [Fimbriimonadaceae bacterium]
METLVLQHSDLTARDRARKRADGLWAGSISLVGIAVALMILCLIGYIVARGLPAMTWEFLSQPPIEGMSRGGIWPMIRGSLLLMAGTLIIVLPIGILGGICLAEYAGQNAITRLMRACVTSLAGTPSIIYGLFGLAIFVIMMKMGVSLMAGWLTLSLLALPVIILSTEQAIKAVPDSLVEGSLALGLSRWQTMAKVVLPNAMPGILTGVVLSTGRAAGEAPPILLTAGIYFSSGPLVFGWETLHQPVANLPYHLAEGYRQGGVIPERIIWGTCLSLLLLVLFINLGAIIVRSRLRKFAQS